MKKGLFNVYWFSYQELRELNACTAPEPTTAPASPDVRREAVRELRKLAVKYGDWFSDLAFEKAHSEVDEDQPASPSKETLRRAKQLGDQDSEYLTTCEEALDAATVPEVDR